MGQSDSHALRCDQRNTRSIHREGSGREALQLLKVMADKRISLKALPNIGHSRMHIELLRQFGQLTLALDRCQRHLRFDIAECVRRVLVAIFRVPLPALSLPQTLTAPLSRLSEFSRLPLFALKCGLG